MTRLITASRNTRATINPVGWRRRTPEGFFDNSKRPLDGTYHHVSGKHIPLYLAELDYKYNTRKATDGARTIGGIQKMAGKRLMLRKPENSAK